MQFAASSMQKARLPLLGVLNGTDPLQIVVPEFTVRDVTQSSPLAGYPNVLTMALVASVNLDTADGCVVTVSGFTGAVAGSNVTLGVTKDGEDALLFCGNASVDSTNTGVFVVNPEPCTLSFQHPTPDTLNPNP